VIGTDPVGLFNMVLALNLNLHVRQEASISPALNCYKYLRLSKSGSLYFPNMIAKLAVKPNIIWSDVFGIGLVAYEPQFGHWT
jgi:hypothetical protein